MLTILIIVCPPVWVVEWCRTEQHLWSRITRLAVWSALQVVLCWARINHIDDTAIGTRGRSNFCRAVVSRETCLPFLADLEVYSTTSCGTHHTCRRNDTLLICITDAKRISQVTILLRDTEVRVLCETCVEEVTYVVINLRCSPTIKTGWCILRVIVHSLVFTILLCICIICVTTVCCIISQVWNLRSPTHGRWWVVRIHAVTLCINSLTLKLLAHCLCTQVGRECNLRTTTICLTTLGGNDDDTIRGTDTIEGRSCLTLQYIDALDIVWVDIDRTVCLVGTSYRSTSIIVCRRSNRHTIYHVKRRVIAWEWTGTTDDNLSRCTRSTRRLTNVNTSQLTLHSASQRASTSNVQIFRT